MPSTPGPGRETHGTKDHMEDNSDMLSIQFSETESQKARKRLNEVQKAIKGLINHGKDTTEKEERYGKLEKGNLKEREERWDKGERIEGIPYVEKNQDEEPNDAEMGDEFNHTIDDEEVKLLTSIKMEDVGKESMEMKVRKERVERQHTKRKSKRTT